MEVIINLDEFPEGMPLNEFRQMASELEIVAKRDTFPTNGPKVDKQNVEVREIMVSYESHGSGGFSYGVRDFVSVPSEEPHIGRGYVAVAGASHTSLSIWEEYVPEEHRKELFEYTK